MVMQFIVQLNVYFELSHEVAEGKLRYLLGSRGFHIVHLIGYAIGAA